MNAVTQGTEVYTQNSVFTVTGKSAYNVPQNAKDST